MTARGENVSYAEIVSSVQCLGWTIVDIMKTNRILMMTSCTFLAN